MNLETLRGKLSYQALLLAGFALLASALLGFADLGTKDAIAQRLAEDLQASLEQVVPKKYYDNNLLESKIIVPSKDEGLGADETLVYVARKQGKVSAVSFMLKALNGYSGTISMIIGIDVEGNILGVRVISHAETPGLGDKIELSKADWILDFNGRSLDGLSVTQWKVKKDGGVFDQFSGATITPRAVVGSVYLGLKFFEKHKAELVNH